MKVNYIPAILLALLAVTAIGWKSFDSRSTSYYGLSTETRPTSSQGAKAGASYYETDTGDVYLYNGTSWSERYNHIFDPAHESIHHGTHYMVCQSFVLAADSARTFLIVPPDSTKDFHLSYYVFSTLTCSVRFYEGCTATAKADSAITPINSNRNSANTSMLAISTAPTAVGDSLLIFADRFGTASASGKTNESGNTRNENEVILKRGSKYIFRVTSLAAANTIQIRFFWYERPKGDL